MLRMRNLYVLLVALVLVFSAGAAEIPPVSEADFQKLKTKIQGQSGREGGNWGYYEMEDWQKNQKPEERTGSARWDVPAGAWYFNFGPTGIRVAFDRDTPREAVVMFVFPDSPADKKIFRGDRIVGVNGKNFTSDEPFPGDKSWAIKGPRLEVAKAIEESEGNPSLKGILTFTVKRGLATIKVPIQLEQLGSFSPTFPYNCKKSRKLAESAGDWFVEHAREHTWRGKTSTHLKWGPSRMGDWVDFPAQLALLSFGDRYKKYFEPTGSGGAAWSWISGIRLINAAEKQQLLNDKGLITKLEEMSASYAAKSGPSGAYSHKTWYEGAPMQMAFAAGLNTLGQALAQKCGADIAEDSYLRTRYLLTCRTNEKGNIGYGAANGTNALTAADAKAHIGNINPSIVATDELAKWRLVGASACTTLAHFIDPRDSYSEAFVKRGVRHAMSARWSSRQGHACSTLTFFYNALACSIAPLVGEEEMYRIYMDDMKWWLNMARCHDGGWYFEPKIDTECHKYERVHMTAAAIIMLNAPLRELYCNGKGMTDPAAARAAATTSRPSTAVATVAKPTPKAEPKPVRKARRLTEERQQKLDDVVISTLEQMSSKSMLEPVPLTMQFTRQKVLVRSAADGKVVFQPEGGNQTARVRWKTLSTTDKATLAMFMADLRPESGDIQAVAGVYMEHLGRPRIADEYYEAAGDSSAGKLQKLFE